MPRTKRTEPTKATIIPPIELKAGPDRCQEASTLSTSRIVASPCNAPAANLVGWKGRSDTPILMCAMCTDHNVRNRGGYIVSGYTPKIPLPPEPAPIGHNSLVTDNDLIAENHRLEDQIKAGMAKFNEWAAPLKARIKEIEDDIFARLVSRNADSTKTDAGTAYISRLATVKIENSEHLFDFAADNWDTYGDEIKVVISKAGVDKYMEDNNGALPPGTSLSKFSKLNIRRS